MTKSVVLSRIARLLDKEYFIVRKNHEFFAILRCCELEELYDEYSTYLEPYWYNTWNGKTYENDNEQYSVFYGLDSVFRSVLTDCPDKIIPLLTELTASFYGGQIEENPDAFNQLGNLYQLMGLEIYYDEKVSCVPSTLTDSVELKENALIEKWLEEEHPTIFDSYTSALDSFVSGNAGACVESCRTTLVGLFERYKGTETFAKWIRGAFNVGGDSQVHTTQDLTQALEEVKTKQALATFFGENQNGNLTKTKAIYSIYAMMSDYGTHRVEGSIETPTMDDAHFILRLLTSILCWVYAIKK